MLLHFNLVPTNEPIARQVLVFLFHFRSPTLLQELHVDRHIVHQHVFQFPFHSQRFQTGRFAETVIGEGEVDKNDIVERRWAPRILRRRGADDLSAIPVTLLDASKIERPDSVPHTSKLFPWSKGGRENKFGGTYEIALYFDIRG